MAAIIVKPMRSKLLKNTVIYTVGQMATQALPFILLPILTRYLLPAEYGSLATYNIMVNILAVFCGLRAYVLVTANYFQLPKAQLIEFMGEVWFSFLWTTLLTLVIATMGFFVFHAYLAFVGFGWLLVGVVIAASQFWVQTLLAIWRCEERPMPYVVFSFCLALVQFVMVLLFVVGMEWGWHGRIVGQLIPVLCLAILAFFLVRQKFPFVFSLSWQGQKALLHFCLPLVPYQLSSWLTGAVDRMILAAMLGLTITGVYMSGYQITLAIAILASVLNMVWGPVVLKFLASDNCHLYSEKRKIVQATYMAMALFLGVGVLYGVSAYFGVAYLLPHQYQASRTLIFPLVLGFVASGWYYLFSYYFVHFKRSYLLSSLGIVMSIIKLFATWFLVWLMGMVGAAWAIVIVNLCNVFVFWGVSYRLFPMPWMRVLLLRRTV